MSNSRLQRFYLLALIALFTAVALARFDLFCEAYRVTLRQLARGGPMRWKILGEIFLFGGILLLTLKIIPARVDVKRDSLLAALGCAAGWLIEAWGTRTGLWVYYTRESPPLWVVPVWPLGVLVVDRISQAFQARFGPSLSERAQGALCWAYFASFAAVFSAFAFRCAPWPSCAAVLAVVMAGLAFRMRPGDVWPMLAGLLYVFFADFWGTTNNCWTYYPQRFAAGTAFGVLFGMFLDSAVVLLCLKAARLWSAALPRPKGGLGNIGL
ncbi:MAG: hypothetical protein HY922_10955 [Elusimicrobia bacterium]|nr:hypothetical protein [Elusimicrobiota bacterium]